MLVTALSIHNFFVIPPLAFFADMLFSLLACLHPDTIFHMHFCWISRNNYLMSLQKPSGSRKGYYWLRNWNDICFLISIDGLLALRKPLCSRSMLFSTVTSVLHKVKDQSAAYSNRMFLITFNIVFLLLWVVKHKLLWFNTENWNTPPYTNELQIPYIICYAIKINLLLYGLHEGNVGKKKI